ncbi:type II toxin-antitoxin system RelB family antitoxin [Corynebacterium renale]|uniref:Ribbon-helix-helix CopG family protein n=1 Tax=Corynebacterium renale TaxID=1724 RepID=A0A2A9DQ78_9CORY|nr:DUF6290 family protein [Corynebacterium renale]PFG28848.1 hypothetical protein ATK06_1974 [Corynebacterium renale]SQI25662.1 Uncharacterised protein [Corynebacterium renale]
MNSSTLSIRIIDEDKKLIADYATTMNVSVAEFVRQATLETIEDELDIKSWDDAKREYYADPETFSLEEIEAKYL